MNGILNWVDATVARSMANRGMLTRLIQIADLSCRTITSIGVSKVAVLSILCTQNKENHDGQMVQINIARHRNPLYCAVAAISVSLMLRYDMQHEKIDYQDGDGALGGAYLYFKNGNPFKAASYPAHLKSNNSVLAEVKGNSTKKTHAYRLAAAIFAIEAGVPGEEVDMQGQWELDGERQKAYSYAAVPTRVLQDLSTLHFRCSITLLGFKQLLECTDYTDQNSRLRIIFCPLSNCQYSQRLAHNRGLLSSLSFRRSAISDRMLECGNFGNMGWDLTDRLSRFMATRKRPTDTRRPPPSERCTGNTSQENGLFESSAVKCLDEAQGKTHLNQIAKDIIQLKKC